MAEVVDLTLSSDDELPSVAARPAPKLAPGPVPQRREPLEPLQNVSQDSWGGGGSWRQGQGAKPRRRSVSLLGDGGSPGPGPSSATPAAPEELQPAHEPLVAAMPGPTVAGQRGRPPRRRALAGLRGMLDDSWDGSLPEQQKQQQLHEPPEPAQLQALPHPQRSGSGGAGPSRDWVAPGAAAAAAAAPDLEFRVQLDDWGYQEAGAAPVARERPRRQRQQRPWDAELGASQLEPEDDPEWEPGASQQEQACGLGPGLADADEDGDGSGPSPSPQKKQRRRRLTQAEREQQAAGKARLREEKKLEKARERERKKEAAAQEKATRKQEREYDSEAKALKWVTVVLDPKLMSSRMGLQIASRLQQTTTEADANNHVLFEVRDTGLGGGVMGIKWVRKVPAGAVGGGVEAWQDQGGYLGTQQSQAQQGAHQLVDEEMPNVMVCMEAPQFVEEVQRDQLGSLLQLLDARCTGYRPSLTVCGLSAYLMKRERQEGARNLQARSTDLGFVRAPIDDFVAGLAIECPTLSFRDVVDETQAGEHVLALTRAIAREPYKATDAATWLGAHSRASDTQAMRNLLASYPLDSEALRAFAFSLQAMPVTALGPQVAHAVASEYQSLGVLMQMLLDPSRPDKEKQGEIARLRRPGGSSAVGPAAARRLHELLTSDNPDLPVNPKDN